MLLVTILAKTLEIIQKNRQKQSIEKVMKLQVIDHMENKIGPKCLCMLCKQIFQSESELDKHFCQCVLPNSRLQWKEK